MNIEKIVNYFRKWLQSLRQGLSKVTFRRSRSETKTKASNDRMTWMDFGEVFLKTLKLLSNFFYVILILLTLFGAGIGFGYLGSQIEAVTPVDSKEIVSKVNQVSMVSEMTYSDSTKIADIDTDLLRTPIKSDAISDNVKHAIVATEDENFEQHKGVVPKAVFRALASSVLGVGSTSGGSTLTQQLIKQQVTGDAPTFKRKAAEIIYALQLERQETKNEILTNYLNVSPFGRNNKGQNIAGIEEASQGIFGVSASDLTIPQAAYLAGLPQSPIVYSPYTAAGQLKDAADLSYGLARQKDVLYNMYRAGYLNKTDYENYKAYDVSQDFLPGETPDTVSHDYLYYSVMDEAQDLMYDYLIKRDNVSAQDLKNNETKEKYQELASKELRTGGYTVKSTIDNTVYNAMQTAAEQYGSRLDQGGNRGVEVGNVLMDNATGAVLGFVGGRNYETNQNNHAFDTKRSPGSSIKPILPYGIAIDQGLMGSASVLSNYPTTFSSGAKIMHGSDEGTTMINLQEALNTSWNIPAYWTYQTLRKNNVDVEGYMTKLGYDISDYSIESLPLGGGIETTVEQQVNAYQMLANGGVYQKGHIVDSITDSTGKVIYQFKPAGVQVFSKATASIMSNLLKEVVVKEGTTKFYSELKNANSAAASADWMGKTGTTDNYSDVWLVVSTPGVTLGGWAGYDNNASMNSSSGYMYNAQYMAQLTSAIYNANPTIFKTSDKFTIDSSAIKASVLKSTGLKPATVNVNGRNISVSGEMVDSYWAKNGPGDTTYKFAIGGTDSDYQKAWASILGGR